MPAAISHGVLSICLSSTMPHLHIYKHYIHHDTGAPFAARLEDGSAKGEK